MEGDVMLTKFGKELRALRLERDELLRDMADKLGVTVAYLSAVENGKRRIPDEWIQKISAMYNLSEEKEKKLQEYAYEDKNEIRINMEGITMDQRNLVYSFARRFQNLGTGDIKELQNVLDKRRRE